MRIALNAIEEAKRTGKDVVIVDTASAWPVDEVLMKEISDIKERCPPRRNPLCGG